jgi:hypothetical protein
VLHGPHAVAVYLPIGRGEAAWQARVARSGDLDPHGANPGDLKVAGLWLARLDGRRALTAAARPPPSRN